VKSAISVEVAGLEGTKVLDVVPGIVVDVELVGVSGRRLAVLPT